MDSTLKNRMTVRKGIPLPEKQRICVPKEKHAAGMGQEAFSGRTAKEKWREHMRENPYKRLPPIERRQDGSLYRMTPAQRKQANALICRECCCYEDGNCMLLDDGGTHTCPQTILSRSAVSGSAGRSCRKSERWKRRFSGIRS